MRLVPQCIASWPKLAWVASFDRKDTEEIHVLHGPMVETADDWIVEAAWAGDFAGGDFDKTDLVFGTGIRRRGNQLAFVTSGSVFDQLWYASHVGQTFVANSLPALMAVAGIGLADDYPHYRRDLHSVKRGLTNRVKHIPTNAGNVTSVYFHNLSLAGGELTEIPKPDSAPDFGCYDDYHAYLISTAKSLQKNFSSPHRRFQVSPLSSISSGYDSPAAAVVARDAGCTATVTIKDSASLWRGSDSGAPVAAALGMSCTEYRRTAYDYPLEETVWAGCAWGGTLNYALFDYPTPLCLFFTGWHGDTMWDRIGDDQTDPFVRPDVGSLGFCELRLHRGVWQCSIPFWGVRHFHQLKQITRSAEMSRWQVKSSYDKPIARRLVEEAGVPRELFGQIKKNVSLPDPFPWPRSPSAQKSFRAYLQSRGNEAPGRWKLEFFRRAAIVESLLHQNVLHRFGLRKRFRPWIELGSSTAVYCWANEQLKSRYADHLQASGVSSSSMTSSTS